MDPEKEYRNPGPFFSLFENKDSTHTFNNKGQNCIECKLNHRGHMRDHHLLQPMSPDKDQSFLIFGSEKKSLGSFLS